MESPSDMCLLGYVSNDPKDPATSHSWGVPLICAYLVMYPTIIRIWQPPTHGESL